MPPQPLSSYRKGPPALVVGAEYAIETHPQLAAEIAKCIGAAAEIDTYLGNILALMLGAEAEIAIAMYGAIFSAQAREAALRAAAEKALEANELEVFDACQAWAYSALRPRHRFAHWVWAHSPQIDRAILFIDPVAIHDVQRRQQKTGSGAATRIDPRLDRRKVLVYRAKDITDAQAEISRASIAVFTLMNMLRATGAARGREHRWLAKWLQTHSPHTDRRTPPSG